MHTQLRRRTGLGWVDQRWFLALVVTVNCGGATTNDGGFDRAQNGAAGGGTGGAGGTTANGTPDASVTGCVVEGVAYPAGGEFSKPDCERCKCLKDGMVSCSKPKRLISACKYVGFLVSSETSLPSIDDCNTCSCRDTGEPTCNPGPMEMICTEHDCTGACSYAGRSFPNGASILSTDGCNSCSCSEGTVTCGDVPCACDPNVEYWRRYEKANASDCAVVDFACPPGSSVFTNACGCGCEQSRECPREVFCDTTTSSSAAGSFGREARPDASCGLGGVCPLSYGMRPPL